MPSILYSELVEKPKTARPQQGVHSSEIWASTSIIQIAMPRNRFSEIERIQKATTEHSQQRKTGIAIDFKFQNAQKLIL